MFRKLLGELKKRLEEKPEAAPVEESVKEESIVETEEEVIDILSFVEKHGTVDKDALPQKPASSGNKIPKISKKRASKVKVESTEEFFEEPELEKTDGSEEILAYVAKHGVELKGDDIPETSQKGSKGIYKKKRAMEKRIDLHGCSVEDAERIVIRTFDEAKRVGITQLLIVHGRGMHSIGNGGEDVLRQRVRQMLDRELVHRVQSYKYASGGEGGDGATRVFLR